MGFHALYQTQLLPNHPQLGDRDLLAESIEACRVKGFKVIPYIPVAHPVPAWVVREHPDWLLRNSAGEYVTIAQTAYTGMWSAPGAPLMYMLCSNTSYRETILGIVGEICENYDVPAIYFDGPKFGYKLCYCPPCQERFREKVGSEMPRISSLSDVNWDDPAVHAFIEWRNEEEGEFFASLRAVVKKNNLPLVFNIGGAAIFHSGFMNRVVDRIPYGDCVLTETGNDFLNTIESGNFISSTGKLVWQYFGHNDPYIRTAYGEQDIESEAFAIVAAGATPVSACAAKSYYDESKIPHLREAFDYLKSNEGLLDNLQQTKFIALPYSQRSAQWYGRDDPSDRYTACYTALSAILRNAHHQITNIYEENLFRDNTLKDYKVVCLSNHACLSDASIETIMDFVRAGGGLIATGVTSLFDEEGYERGEFGLREVLRASYQGQRNDTFDTYLSVSKDHPVTRFLSVGQLVAAPEQTLVKALNGGEGICHTALGSQLTEPHIIASTYGEGRVVYIASPVEKLYLEGKIGHISEIMRLFDGAIRWCCQERILLEVEAGSEVVTVLAEKQDLSLIHMINLLGEISERPHITKRYVPPLHDIAVRIRVDEDRGVNSVKLVRRGLELQHVRKDGFVEIVVPELGDYDALAISYSNDKTSS